MDKLHDTILFEQCSGNENKDFSSWSLWIMAVLEGKVIHCVVQGTEDEPPKEVANAHASYAKKGSDDKGKYCHCPGWEIAVSYSER